MFPPEATRSLYLFPMMHHSFRQSQITDITTTNNNDDYKIKFPKLSQLVHTISFIKISIIYNILIVLIIYNIVTRL